MPLKLGTAQNVIDSWTLIRIFDLNPLKTEYDLLYSNYVALNSSLYNNNFSVDFIREMYNYQYLLDHTTLEVRRKFKQLLPETEIKLRQKRGLINAAGSIIKAITGNLDQDDARKYDKTIHELSKKNTNLQKVIQHQTSLTISAINKFNESISKLSSNQLILRSKIMQIENMLKELNLKLIFNKGILFYHMIFTQLITAMNIISKIIENLENAITFAKLATLHPSIIEPEDLLFELQNLNKILKTNKLPYEPNLENIQLYEKLATVKAYQKNNKLIFIIELPIVEIEHYYHYHLFSFPVENHNNIFQFVIPKTKFLFLNEHSYSLTNKECQEIIPGEFICHLPDSRPVNENAPCEIQLIQFTKNYSNCHPNYMMLKDEKIQKIQHNQWIVILPEETTITNYCNNGEEKSSLKGSYVIKIPEDCKIQLKSTILQSYQERSKETKLVKIPAIKFKQLEVEKYQELPETKLETIDLDNLHQIKSQLQNLEIKPEDDENIQTEILKINLWTIFIYLLITSYIIYKIIKKIKKRKINKESTGEQISIDQLELKNQGSSNPNFSSKRGGVK